VNIDIAGAAWVMPLSFALQGLSALLILLRLVRGPRATDRVVAIDALTLLGIGVVALLALATAQPMVLDAAVVLALVSFLGTTAFILMFRRRGPAEDGDAANPAAAPAGTGPTPRHGMGDGGMIADGRRSAPPPPEQSQ
jgi:multicomponent Na+:H+ antiporter subunit F